ncbi:MAG: preprotein translocase subunit SecG, partial [Parvicella sp.]
MITKIFFTMLVIIIVGVLFSKQRSNSSPTTTSNSAKKSPRASLSTNHLAYSLVALLIVVSIVLAYFNRSEANQIITLNVYGTTGVHTQYQAYQKNINGRSFTTT